MNHNFERIAGGTYDQAVRGFEGADTNPARPRAAGFNFSRVIAIVMCAHNEPPDRLLATAGNIKYLQRQGAVPNNALGRGRAGTYSADDVRLILFGMELHRAGLTAIRIKPIVEQFGDAFLLAFEAKRPLTIALPSTMNRSVTITLDAGKPCESCGGFGHYFVEESDEIIPCRACDALQIARIKGTVI